MVLKDLFEFAIDSAILCILKVTSLVLSLVLEYT